jgi:hypothetical protein
MTPVRASMKDDSFAKNSRRSHLLVRPVNSEFV